MARGKVTAETVNALEPGPVDQLLWDDKLAGFGVKVTPAGGRVYVLQYRLGGRGHKTRRYTIGNEGSPWRPLSARKEAERLLSIVRQGTDIAATTKEKKRVAVDLAFDKYVATFAGSTLKAQWPKSWQQTKRCLEIHATATLGDKPLPDVTAADVRRLLAKLDAQPATRRNLFAALSFMFNKAVEGGDLASSPITGVKPPPQVEDRDRSLTDDELRWLWGATSSEGGPYGAIVRNLLWFGQRRSEVAGLPWSELNRDLAEWRLPKERAKNGNEHIVPLTARAVADFDALAGGTRWPRKGLVFPSGAGTAASGFSKMKRRLDKAMAEKAAEDGADFEPWKIHDLRRTVATNMQRLGVRYEVIEHLLNHRERARTGIGKVYQTHDFKPEKLAALERWEARLVHLLDGGGGVVIPMRGTRNIG